jgi:hypothetical protein
MTYYRELNTMTKWRRIGHRQYEPIDPWPIDRDPQDVLKTAVFSGPYKEKSTQAQRETK